MPRSIASAVDKVARQTIGKNWDHYATLLRHWPEIVGPEYARVTTPVKIAFPYQPNEPHRKGGTITIRLPKGLAMEFAFKAEIMRQRINIYFGYDAIAKIAVEPVHMTAPVRVVERKLTPDEQAVIQETTGDIEDSELRATLESFGNALMQGSKRH